MKSIKIGLLLLTAFIAGCAVNHKKKDPAEPPVVTLKKLDTSALLNSCAEGKKLFIYNCSACHFLNQPFVGPPLTASVSTLDKQWLIKFIRNSEAMRDDGDTTAIAIYGKYHNLSMTSFPNLTDAEIESIIAYAKNCGAGER